MAGGTQRDKTTDSGAYRRRSRPVPVRRGPLDWRSWPWRRAALIAVAAAAVAGSIGGLRAMLWSDPRFTLPADGSGLIVSGVQRLDELAVREVFAADLGAPLVEIPIETRRLRLIETPWVREATVARLWPDRLWAHVEEREPVAYARLFEDGASMQKLIDREGVFLDPPPGVAFDLPVVDGVGRALDREERARRVRLVETLIADLAGGERRYDRMLGSINVADPEDPRATTVHEGDVIELRLGDRLFRHRFETFLRYIDGWKRQFGSVGLVDLRFEGQVVVLPAGETERAMK